MKWCRLLVVGLLGAILALGLVPAGAIAAPGDTITLNATVRDFSDSHSDFEGAITGWVKGLVEENLGADGTPVLANPGSGDGAIASATSFHEWYHDAPGVNQAVVLPLSLVENGAGVYEFYDSNFFPIDGQLLGNEGRSHNYHFTLELHTDFTYQGGEVFQFSGDDDVWVFINDKLVIDIGGVHSEATEDVELDSLGLTPGQTYSFDFFFAERHTVASNFKIQTSVELNPTPPIPEVPTIALISIGLVGVAGFFCVRRLRQHASAERS